MGEFTTPLQFLPIPQTNHRIFLFGLCLCLNTSLLQCLSNFCNASIHTPPSSEGSRSFPIPKRSDLCRLCFVPVPLSAQFSHKQCTCLCFVFVVLGIEPRMSHTLCKHATTEPYPKSPKSEFYYFYNIMHSLKEICSVWRWFSE